MKTILLIAILFVAAMCASCHKGARESCDVRAEAKDNTMTDQELDTFVKSSVNPPPPPWSDRAIAMVIDAVRVADSNAVTIVQEILLTNRYRAEFTRAETEGTWIS